MKLSKELTERKRPSALIFASCNSLYSSITDILRANGIIAAMNISKDLGEVTEGKVFRLDEQQKTVMSDIRDVSFFHVLTFKNIMFDHFFRICLNPIPNQRMCFFGARQELAKPCF